MTDAKIQKEAKCIANREERMTTACDLLLDRMDQLRSKLKDALLSLNRMRGEFGDKSRTEFKPSPLHRGSLPFDPESSDDSDACNIFNRQHGQRYYIFPFTFYSTITFSNNQTKFYKNIHQQNAFRERKHLHVCDL